jgi:ABC-type transport system substrate-binding protein
VKLRERRVGIFVVFALVLSPFALFVIAEGRLRMQAPTSIKNGPYVDRIIFDVIPQDDQMLLALQNDEIDLIVSNLSELFGMFITIL